MEIRKRHILFGLGLLLIGVGAVLRAFTIGRLYFDFNELFYYRTTHPLYGLGVAIQVLGVLLLLPFLLLTALAMYKSWKKSKHEKQRLFLEARAKRAQERAKRVVAETTLVPEPTSEPQEPAQPSWAPPPLNPSGGPPH